MFRRWCTFSITWREQRVYLHYVIVTFSPAAFLLLRGLRAAHKNTNHLQVESIAQLLLLLLLMLLPFW